MRNSGDGNVLHVNVSFNDRGFVGTLPELRESPVVALSLAGLRRRLESLMVPDQPEIKMHLDRSAQAERDRRRFGGPGAADRPDTVYRRPGRTAQT